MSILCGNVRLLVVRTSSQAESLTVIWTVKKGNLNRFPFLLTLHWITRWFCSTVLRCKKKLYCAEKRLWVSVLRNMSAKTRNIRLVTGVDLRKIETCYLLCGSYLKSHFLLYIFLAHGILCVITYGERERIYTATVT